MGAGCGCGRLYEANEATLRCQREEGLESAALDGRSREDVES